jgi:hypothetical protein
MNLINKIAARAFPAFAVGFALFYAPGYSFTGATSTVSWPLFTYFPAIDTWRWFLIPGNDNSGPPMWWYGWIASAVLVGLVFALIALLLPERAIRNILAALVWIVPICAFIFLLNWELSWFVTGWKPIWFS